MASTKSKGWRDENPKQVGSRRENRGPAQPGPMYKPSKTAASRGTLRVPQLVLVGVGGIIGAGFFLGAGLPIRTAGPAVLLAFLIGAVLTAQVIGALSSMAVDEPLKGSFMAYAGKYIGSYAGYLEGWGYYIASILTVASESVAMAIFSRMWFHGLPTWSLAGIFSAIVLVINAFGVKNFDRVESIFSVIKIAALVGFILYVGMVLLNGHLGTPTRSAGSASARPGFFPTGAGGMFQAMLIVVFAYAGIGVFGTAAAQMKHPKKIDRAAWMTVITLAVLYIVSIGLLLLVLPWEGVSTSGSPFVLALQHTRLPWLGQILNLVILVASFSVMAGAVYSANQILWSLGQNQDAPRFVTKNGHNDTPYGALLATTCLIAAVLVGSFLLPANVYNFLISASSFLTFLNWFLILWAFLAWRRSKRPGIHISSLAFGQPFSSWLSMAFILFLTVYALFQADQRFGFYAFGGLVVLLSVAYIWVRRHRKSSAGPVGTR